MESLCVPFSLLTIFHILDIGVLLFIFDIYFLKELRFASRQTCLHLAWALLKLLKFSKVLFDLALLSIALLCATALLQSSLNQDLFFLGRVDNLGIFLSEMSRSSSEKCSAVLSVMFWLRRVLHSSEWFVQFAFLKLYWRGGGDFVGMFDSKRMGKWSDPWVSSRADQFREGAKEGVHRDKSNEDNFRSFGFW